jgi:hypothetical protein
MRMRVCVNKCVYFFFLAHIERDKRINSEGVCVYFFTWRRAFLIYDYAYVVSTCLVQWTLHHTSTSFPDPKRGSNTITGFEFLNWNSTNYPSPRSSQKKTSKTQIHTHTHTCGSNSSTEFVWLIDNTRTQEGLQIVSMLISQDWNVRLSFIFSLIIFHFQSDYLSENKKGMARWTGVFGGYPKTQGLREDCSLSSLFWTTGEERAMASEMATAGRRCIRLLLRRRSIEPLATIRRIHQHASPRNAPLPSEAVARARASVLEIRKLLLGPRKDALGPSVACSRDAQVSSGTMPLAKTR